MLINKKKRIRETCRAKEKKTVTSILWLFKLKRVHKFQSTIIQSHVKEELIFHHLVIKRSNNISI